MDLTEKTLSSAEMFRGNLLRLRQDRVSLPDGRTASREVVEHPGGVGVVALTDDDRVILVRQFRYPYREVVTEIPAGKREPGEDPLCTARRELEEETGLTADEFRPLGTVYPSPGYCDEVIYLYLATGLHQTAAHPDDDEFLDSDSQPLEDLVRQVMDGSFPDAKTQIAVLKAWTLIRKEREQHENG